MASDWIKMRKSLLGDPRVVRISSALNADRFRTIGGLFSAWCLLDEQTIDGVLIGYDAKSFDEIVGIQGIAEAMQRVGWLSISSEGITAVEFTKHNGETAKRRAQENVRKASARNADKSRTNLGQTSLPEEEEEESLNPNPNLSLGGITERPDLSGIDWDIVTERACWIASELPTTKSDRISWARIGVLMQLTLSDAEVTDAISTAQRRRKPASYFMGTLARRAEHGGWNFNTSLRAITVPNEIVEAIPTNSKIKAPR